LAPEPKIVWRTPLSDVALAGVAASSKYVLVADRELDDTVDAWRCLDALTGELRWTVRYPAPGSLDYGNSPRTTPLIDGDRVFLVGAHGHVTCVSLESGKQSWQRNMKLAFGVTEEMKWGFCGSPLLVDGKLILNPGGPEASVVALEPATGKTIWATPGNPASYGSLVAGKLGGKLQIVGHDQTTLGGWDPATGKRLWTLASISKDDFNVPTPIIEKGQLIVTTESDGARIYNFTADGQIIPEPQARFAGLKPDTQSAVVVGNRLFGASQELYALKLDKNLELAYEAQDEAFAEHVSIIASPDRLLITTGTGELILAAAQGDKFKVLSRQTVLEGESGLLSHPAIVGKRLFVRGSREVVCVDLADEAP
jgi:outer membrane protein assembly factor BamB